PPLFARCDGGLGSLVMSHLWRVALFFRGVDDQSGIARTPGDGWPRWDTSPTPGRPPRTFRFPHPLGVSEVIVRVLGPTVACAERSVACRTRNEPWHRW